MKSFQLDEDDDLSRAQKQQPLSHQWAHLKLLDGRYVDAIASHKEFGPCCLQVLKAVADLVAAKEMVGALRGAQRSSDDNLG